MREVSQFVIVLPGRLTGSASEEGRMLLDAMRREYPQYEFEPAAGRPLDEDFRVIPIVGRIGAGEGDDPDRVYMCKPLDPAVIPDLLRTLQLYETVGAVIN